MSLDTKQKSPTTREEWLEEAKKRFGPNVSEWKFKCPVCEKVQSITSVEQEIEAGIFNPARSFSTYQDKPNPVIYQECTNCDWCAYGLFGGPIRVTYPEEFEEKDGKVYLVYNDSNGNKFLRREESYYMKDSEDNLQLVVSETLDLKQKTKDVRTFEFAETDEVCHLGAGPKDGPNQKHPLKKLIKKEIKQHGRKERH